ncbi:MAG: sigma-70 family RNA polymerase sigma factor, partial [Syntrophomonas sp.]|nr:sigma-70 family RNA polymerase sigma factor [Syntrophomonas sp.]
MISILEPDRNIALNINELVSEYGNSLLRMCFLYLKDIHLAEDAVQETFLKVYKNHPQFKGDSEVKTWIMRIAINVCKNYLRSSWWKRVDVAESLNSIPTDTNMEAIPDDTLLLEIMKLSPKYKEVILLF